MSPADAAERWGAGRARLSIIDTQAVKCIPVRGPRGYDAHKKVLGRKRVALVDADGTWLAVAVVPASVQDRDTLEALDPARRRGPACGRRSWIGPSPQRAAKSGRTGMACATVWSSVTPLRRASSCSRAVGSWNAAWLARALEWAAAGPGWPSGRLRRSDRVRGQPVRRRGSAQPYASEDAAR